MPTFFHASQCLNEGDWELQDGLGILWNEAVWEQIMLWEGAVWRRGSTVGWDILWAGYGMGQFGGRGYYGIEPALGGNVVSSLGEGSIM